jgi:tetratricopeptide (TPR) repeat protein
VVVAVAVVATCALAVTPGCARRSCATAHGDGDWEAAVRACAASYRETASPADGVRLLDAHMRRDEWPEVARLGRALLASPARGTAFRYLALLERQRSAHQAAAIHAMTAVAIHAAAGDDRELARDAQTLSGIWWYDGAFAAALAAGTLARDAALRTGDRRGAGFAAVARADALRMLSDSVGAEHALGDALQLLEVPCDRAWAHLKHGVLLAKSSLLTLADEALTHALADAESCATPDVADSVHLNLAWIELARHRPDAAEAHVRTVVEASDDWSLMLHGLIALERGDLGAAEAHLAAAARVVPPDAEWPWAIADAQAQVAERQGDPVAARAAYRRALAAIDVLREREPARAPVVVATHRGPYEGLFALLARQGRWRDALAVVMDLDARGMLPVTARPGELGLDGVVGGDPAAAAAAPPDRGRALTVDDVLAAWRGRELVIAVATRRGRGAAARARLWRLRVLDGEVTGADVGDAEEAEQLADHVEAHPEDRAAAARLGHMIAPTGTGDLYVLPVGALGRLPLAALRHGARLVIADRPILRVLGVLPQPRRARPWSHEAIAIGDPAGDLAGAAEETAWVAHHEDAARFVGTAATRGRLVAAASADLVHVAAHTDESAAGVALHLADGALSPDELRRLAVAPRLAVLASCGSAAARDEGGWGSLAAALLAGGTETVIATQRTIGDAAAIDLVRRFYRAGGRRAPAAALAAAQVELAAAGGSEWAAFTVLAGPPEAAEGRLVQVTP